MKEYIQPNNKRKKSHARETLFIVLMIMCLGIGFVSGYIVNKSTTTTGSQSKGQSVIDEAYNVLNKTWYNPSDKKINLESDTIKALVSSLGDKHTSYFTFQESVEFNQGIEGTFEGIGVVFTVISDGIMISKVYQDSPAMKAGIEVGDIITKADDNELIGKTSEEVKNLVRGEAGSKITLTIVRAGQTKNVEATRGEVDTSVNGEIRESNGKKFGYIEITTFGSGTGSEVEKALMKFVDAKVDTLVIDLRDNGGGYLTAANDVLNLFFDEGKVIYQMQQKSDSGQKIKATAGTKYNFETNYILVNENTASASEVVSGALQEKKNFKLVGSQTYGKGTAQTQKQLSDGSVLKYTYARWLLPSGTWINGKGLTPDYVVNNIDISTITTKDLKKDLTFDCVDSRVKSMQKMLAILGYDCGRDDGYFSNQTVAMLQRFESDHQLTVDGVYTNEDKKALVSAVVVYVSDSKNDNQYNRLLEMIK